MFYEARITTWISNGWIEPPYCTSDSWRCETVFDYDARKTQLASIEKQMAEPGFWDKQDQAREVTLARKSGLGILEPIDELARG